MTVLTANKKKNQDYISPPIKQIFAIFLVKSLMIFILDYKLFHEILFHIHHLLSTYEQKNFLSEVKQQIKKS